MHIYDQLRDVCIKRIDAGTASIKLLSGIACISPPHLSNFIRGRRDLSPEMFTRLMRAVGFDAEIFPAGKASGGGATVRASASTATGGEQSRRAGSNATAKSGNPTPGRPAKLPCKKL